MRRQRVPNTNATGSAGFVNNSAGVTTRQSQIGVATVQGSQEPKVQQKNASSASLSTNQPQQQQQPTTVSNEVNFQDGTASATAVFKFDEVEQMQVLSQKSEVPNNDLIQTIQSDGEGGNEKKHGRWFTSNKKPSVRARERRIRQNRRLRKILIPKNALMALHEVKGIKMSEFVINSRSEGGFSAKVSINNMQYEGIGNSKVVAKNAACEKALRDHIIFKMIQSNSKQPNSENGDQPQRQIEDQDIEMKEADGEKQVEEDDVPMLNLASFALYKLFSEWENEGFEIPEFRPANSSTNGSVTPPPPNIKRELPANWETMHPASLLCMMRPGIVYTFLGGDGQPPNTTQRVGVCVDGQNFIGEGRSQKLARRNAAIDACNKIFDTNFIKE